MIKDIVILKMITNDLFLSMYERKIINKMIFNLIN